MSNKKYMLDEIENREFLEEIRNDLLRFGHHFPSPGGSAYYLGDDGTPWKERPRETYITARMAHVYSIGAALGHAGSEELIDAALKGLLEELRDRENGGWYAGLTADGGILPDKACYAHAFVILAASSAMLAGRDGAEALMEQAIRTYDEKFWNETEGMACDTWNTEFTIRDDYRGLNANMHTVEAFLAAADVLGEEKYRARAGRIIDHVVGWASENNWRIPEHYTKEWIPELECNKDRPDDPFKPYGATPGHGLEWARLITQWAVSTFRKSKNCEAAQDRISGNDVGARPENDENAGAGKYIQAAENLYNRAVSDAWYADGAPGFAYTTGWDGKPVVHDRMHWVLMEAVNTSAVLYRVTGKDKYKKDYAEFMAYLDEKVLDHTNGSFYHQMDQNNRPIGTVWPGKPDIYHALQATLIPYQCVDVSIAAALFLA